MAYQLEQLKEIGRVTPKASVEIKKSKMGIGFEKLDRNVFDPEKAYDKLAKVGVKWVRMAPANAISSSSRISTLFKTITTGI